MVTVDKGLEMQDSALAYYGLRFVDPALDFDDEEAYDACYAYINGYMATSEVGDLAFTTPHTFRDRLSSLEQWFQQESGALDGDGKDILDDERRILEQFGVYGLRQLGAAATNVLQGWANEVYPERERFARAFCLGSGTLVACGVLHQRTMNYQAAARAEIKSDFDTELQKLLNDGGT